MYSVPVLFFCSANLLLIVANFFAERSFKSRPDLRLRTHAFLIALGLAYLATVVTAIFIGALQELVLSVISSGCTHLGLEKVSIRVSHSKRLRRTESPLPHVGYDAERGRNSGRHDCRDVKTYCFGKGHATIPTSACFTSAASTKHSCEMGFT